MAETLPIGDRFKDKNKVPFQLTLSGGTINLVRFVLKHPLIISPATSRIIKDYCSDIYAKLPIPINPHVKLDVELSGYEVNFISTQINSRRFKKGVETEELLRTRHRHAFWEINLALIKAGGDMQSNFEGFLKKFKLFSESDGPL